MPENRTGGQEDANEQVETPETHDNPNPFHRNLVNDEIRDNNLPADAANLEVESKEAREAEIIKLVDEILNGSWEKNERARVLETRYGRGILRNVRAWLGGEKDFTYDGASGTLKYNAKTEVLRRAAHVGIEAGKYAGITIAIGTLTGGAGTLLAPALVGNIAGRGFSQAWQGLSGTERGMREEIEISRISYYARAKELAQRVFDLNNTPIVDANNQEIPGAETIKSQRNQAVKELINYVYESEQHGVTFKRDEQGNLTGADVYQQSEVAPHAHVIDDMEKGLEAHKKKWFWLEEGLALVGSGTGIVKAIMAQKEAMMAKLSAEGLSLDLDKNGIEHVVRMTQEGMKRLVEFGKNASGDYMFLYNNMSEAMKAAAVNAKGSVLNVGVSGNPVFARLLEEGTKQISSAVTSETVRQALPSIMKSVGGLMAHLAWRGADKKIHERMFEGGRSKMKQEQETLRRRNQPERYANKAELEKMAHDRHLPFPEVGQRWEFGPDNDSLTRADILAITETNGTLFIKLKEYTPEDRDADAIEVIPAADLLNAWPVVRCIESKTAGRPRVQAVPAPVDGDVQGGRTAQGDINGGDGGEEGTPPYEDDLVVEPGQPQPAVQGAEGQAVNVTGADADAEAAPQTAIEINQDDLDADLPPPPLAPTPPAASQPPLPHTGSLSQPAPPMAPHPPTIAPIPTTPERSQLQNLDEVFERNNGSEAIHGVTVDAREKIQQIPEKSREKFEAFCAGLFVVLGNDYDNIPGGATEAQRAINRLLPRNEMYQITLVPLGDETGSPNRKQRETNYSITISYNYHKNDTKIKGDPRFHPNAYEWRGPKANESNVARISAFNVSNGDVGGSTVETKWWSFAESRYNDFNSTEANPSLEGGGGEPIPDEWEEIGESTLGVGDIIARRGNYDEQFRIADLADGSNPTVTLQSTTTQGAPNFQESSENILGGGYVRLKTSDKEVKTGGAGVVQSPKPTGTREGGVGETPEVSADLERIKDKFGVEAQTITLPDSPDGREDLAREQLQRGNRVFLHRNTRGIIEITHSGREWYMLVTVPNEERSRVDVRIDYPFENLKGMYVAEETLPASDTIVPPAPPTLDADTAGGIPERNDGGAETVGSYNAKIERMLEQQTEISEREKDALFREVIQVETPMVQAILLKKIQDGVADGNPSAIKYDNLINKLG